MKSDHPDYEKESATLAGFQGKPLVILKPKNSEDVSLAVKYAKDNSLIISVRSGGHSPEGHSTNTGGVIIDMTLLKDVKIIDSDNHIVRIGSGAVWGDVAKALQGYDLGISSGDTKSVGVGGLTLGGGIGWMVRNHGLSIDHLVGAEIVTADGNILQLSETENQDLFWAIRGGGGNFGIVTHFDFKAYPLNKVVAGTIQYELDNLQNLLTKYRDIMRNSPEELNTSVLIMPSFGPQMPAAVNVVVCYSGQLEDADSVINPLRNLGDVVLDNVQEKNYYEVLEEGHPPQGVKIVSKNTFFDDFSDKIIQDISNIYTSNNPPVMQISI